MVNLLAQLLAIRGTEIYAIIETGGKQYKVSSGNTIDVERLDVAEGGAVELDKVLLLADDANNITVGTPVVAGAKVMATSQGEERGKKVLGIKFKNKTRYTRKVGHRQTFTRLLIQEIIRP